jgi:Kef-type K+ transport system membrane component KefB/nucleotide-binding universal stress UspA family protein
MAMGIMPPIPMSNSGRTHVGRRLCRAFAAALPLAFIASVARAAQGGTPAASEAVLIAQIVILILAGRLLGEAMQRIGQPAVVGQLVAGILLGPSVLGLLWPGAEQAIFPNNGEQKAMIQALSELGILLLLLLTGMETDLALVRKIGPAAIGVSIAGISLPFACGFALGELLPDGLLPVPDKRLITSLFLGTALSISSVKIVALIVREMNFMRRNVGQIIIASAIIDDTIGWIIIAITFGLAQRGAVDAMSLARSVIGTAIFLALSLTLGRRIVFGLIRWTNDNFVSEMPVITAILVIMGAMALTTHLIGVHTVLGAFVAGVLIGESPILTRHIDEQLRGLITAMFAPIFFGMAGLGTDLTVLGNLSLLWLMLAVIAIASLGKFMGAFAGGLVGGLTFRESLALGCGMNARGSTEVIVASIGLSMGVLSEDLFTVIVAMAVATTMAMPPTLRWALSRLPMDEAERARLEREEFESRGFVTNLERMLIAVDQSANGRFASRLAGLIAGSRGMPTTVLHLHADEPPRGADSDERALELGAEAAKAPEEKGRAGRKIDITSRVEDTAPDRAVAREARKGYDFMMIGVGQTASGREFRPEISRVALGFEGPLAIVIARGRHLENPLRSALRILVPTTGTEASRRAAEVAIVIAGGARAPITALYVASGKPARSRGRSWTQAARGRRQEEAILKDVAEMADRYDVRLRTAMRLETAPDDAILREARRGRHNLIVMGVSRRPGDTLFFGDLAEELLERADCSIVFVSSGGVGTAVQGRAQRQIQEDKAKSEGSGRSRVTEARPKGREAAKRDADNPAGRSETGG